MEQKSPAALSAPCLWEDSGLLVRQLRGSCWGEWEPHFPRLLPLGRRASGCFVEDAPSHSQSKIAPFILELKSERNTLRGQGWGVTAE